MTSAVIGAGKALAGIGLEKLYDHLAGRKYGDATEATKDIIAAVNAAAGRIITELSTVVQNAHYQEARTSLKTWIEALESKMSAVSRNVKGAEDDLKAFYNDLKNNNNGIDFVLNKMHNLLIQEVSSDNRGLIGLVCDRLNNDFVDHGKLDKDTYWYLKSLDDYVATQIYWQTAGLALKLFTLQDDREGAQVYAKKIRDRADAQLKYAYTVCHPMIRSFRGSYFDDIPRGRYFWLQKCKDGKFLHIEGERGVKCAWEETGKAHSGSQWRFNPPPDKNHWCELQNKNRENDYMFGQRWAAPYNQYGWTFQLHNTRPEGHEWHNCRFILKPVTKEDNAFKMLNEGVNFREDGQYESCCPWWPDFRAVSTD